MSPVRNSHSERNIGVLLVEDASDGHSVIQRALGSGVAGAYTITRVHTLHETAPAAAAGKTDVVLLELALPDSAGLETLRRVRGRFPQVPVIVLTERHDEAVAVAAVREGAQDYCVKNEVAGPALVRIIRYAIERKRFETLKSQLYRSDRLASVGQLASGVAHEINNPAAFILTNLSLLMTRISGIEQTIDLIQQRAADGLCARDRAWVEQTLEQRRVRAALTECSEMLKDNLAGMHRIRSITSDLKVFSRIESDEAEWVQLNEIVTSACHLVGNELRHRATLVTELGKLPLVAADRGKLSQAVLNLLINATHAIEDGAADRNQIKVRTLHANGHIMLSVEDTGCGISDEGQAKIFEPFFTTKGRVGTGLGLSLAADIVHKHRGRITVRSTLGQGTRFEISLPEDTGLNAQKAQSRGPRKGEQRQHKARILLIDDEPMVRTAFGRILRPVHEVIEAGGGSEALAIVADDPAFDVLLCDLMMPEMDGPKFFERLGTVAPELQRKVMFISGGAFTSRAQAFVAEHRATVLEKPISSRELLSALDEAIMVRTAV